MALFAIGDVFYFNRTYSSVLFCVFCFWLVVLAATRYHVGFDWPAYESMFYEQNGFEAQSIEVGYIFIYKLMEGMPFNAALLVIITISFFFLMLFIRKFSYFKVVAILVYFSDLYFYLNLSGMRQGIALSIALFSVVFVYKKQFVFFFFTIAVACLFHKTAIFFGLAYFVQYFNLTKKNMLIAITGSAIISLSFVTLSEFIADLGYFRNVEMYIDSDYNDTYTLAGFVVGGVKRLMPLVLLYLSCRFSDVRDNLFVKFYVVGLLCFFSLYSSFPDIAVRLSLYFLVFDMIIFNLIFIYAKNIKFKLFCMLVMIAMVGYKIYVYSITGGYIYNNIMW